MPQGSANLNRNYFLRTEFFLSLIVNKENKENRPEGERGRGRGRGRGGFIGRGRGAGMQFNGQQQRVGVEQVKSS